MEQNTALHKLLEIADLAKMIEELVAPGNLERLAPASLSGIRVTLRSIRESLLSCHDSIKGEAGQRSAIRFNNQPEVTAAPAPEASAPRSESPAIVRPPVAEQPRMIQKDLRSSLGQIIERTVS